MDFASALDTNTGDIEKPPVLPQGTYTWRVTKLPVTGQTKSGEWAFIEFQLVAVAADEDVDEDELAEFGNLSSAFSRISFMSSTDPDKEADFKRTLYQVKQFCGNTLQVDVEDDATLREMLDAALGAEFLGRAVHRVVDENTFVDVKHYGPLD